MLAHFQLEEMADSTLNSQGSVFSFPASIKKRRARSNVVTQTCDPHTWEAEAGGSWHELDHVVSLDYILFSGNCRLQREITLKNK